MRRRSAISVKLAGYEDPVAGRGVVDDHRLVHVVHRFEETLFLVLAVADRGLVVALEVGLGHQGGGGDLVGVDLDGPASEFLGLGVVPLGVGLHGLVHEVLDRFLLGLVGFEDGQLLLFDLRLLVLDEHLLVELDLVLLG